MRFFADSVTRSRGCRSSLVIFIVLRIAFAAAPAVRQYGLGFLTTRTWDPNKDQYGILPEIWGTMYTSVLALVIGTAFGVAAAVFLSEGYLGGFVFSVLKIFHVEFHPFWGKLPERVEEVLKNLIELLAAIPSVVYGLWGLFVIIPLIRPACNWLHLKMGWFALFGTDLSGPGVLPAVLVLSIMILPTITAISRDALVSVPPKLRMAAYGLGATPWETIFAVILPTAAREKKRKTMRFFLLLFVQFSIASAKDSAGGRKENHGGNRLPLRGPQSIGGHAQFGWHGNQGITANGSDGGEDHDEQD